MRLRRFIACVLACSVIFVNSSPVAYASVGDNVAEIVIVPFEELAIHAVDAVGNIIDSASDIVLDSIREAYTFWSGLIYDAVLDYRTFVDRLDSTTASSGIAVTGYSLTTVYNSIQYGYITLCGFASLYPSEFTDVLYSLGVSERVFVFGVYSDTSYIVGLYFDTDGRLSFGVFENPLGALNHATVYGVYSLSDLTLHNTLDFVDVYYNKAYAESSDNYLYSTVYAIDWSRNVYCVSGTCIGFPVFCKSGSNTIWDSNVTGFVLGCPYQFYYPDLNSVVWDNSRIIVQPSGTDSSSRGDDLMEMISDYNKTNSYLNSPTAVNYYIGTVNDDGSVDKFFEPGVFDEQTMIFTEPETGTEYQAIEWDYNYETRTYGIGFEDGVLSVDGQAANIVLYTLGDDACVLSYYNGETLVKQVSYNYLMVSQSACNINGHTNTVETTKEATCTAPGERLTTCSVCGHQTVEEIPKLDHTYANYTVQQEPTCTLDGIAVNTCLTCGQEVTELLPALGHDWLPTSITDESWAMPDGISCPDCGGTNFAYDRSDYEVVLVGKNYFDVSVVNSLSSNRYSEVSDNSFVVKFGGGNGFAGTSVRLRDFAPHLVAGRTYTLSFDTESSSKYIYLAGCDRIWSSSSSLTMTDEILDSAVVFYGMNSDRGDSETDCRISNVQIELGTEVTSYEPYKEDEVKLIPPIYHFTCQDCSNTWDAEAIYQHAYTTFTCSRCDETMIQSNEPPMEEQDWFTNFGDALKDFGSNVFKALGNGITKILSGFVSMISGIFGFLSDIVFDGVGDFFSGLSDSSITDFFQQENSDGSTTTTLPGEMAAGMSRMTAFFTGLPADLKGVLTFGIGLMFLLAALKLML